MINQFIQSNFARYVLFPIWLGGVSTGVAIGSYKILNWIPSHILDVFGVLVVLWIFGGCIIVIKRLYDNWIQFKRQNVENRFREEWTK